jgi:meiotic recombination protein REC8
LFSNKPPHLLTRFFIFYFFIFRFVKAEQEKSKRTAEDNDEEPVDFLTFEQLLDPTQNGRIVAAQAFHHTLLLATKGLVCVTQEEPYGTIQLSILEF